MKVSLAELRVAFELTLDQLRAQGGDTIELDDELYWFVPRPQVYDPTSQPAGLTLGSIADDWAQVSAIGRRDAEPIEYALVWMTSVLRALGERGTSGGA